MSQKKLNEISKRIRQIENIYDKADIDNSKDETGKGRNYGSYQHFQSECMKKIDPANPDSPSRIEVISNKYGAHSTERMAQCSMLWKKYRGLDNPLKGLEKELSFAEKVENGEVDEPSQQ